MACELSTGFTLDCKDGIGGIKQIVLVDKALFGDITLESGTEVMTHFEVTNVNTDLFTYDLPTQTGSFEETINFNRDNGTFVLYLSRGCGFVFNWAASAAL